MIFDFVSLMTSGSSTGTIVRPKVHYARPPHPPPDPPIPEASALGQETRHSLFTPHCLAQAELEHTKQRHSFPDRLVRSRSSDIVCPLVPAHGGPGPPPDLNHLLDPTFEFVAFCSDDFWIRFVQRGGAGQLGSGAHESHLPLVGNQAAFKNHSHSDSRARRFASMPSLCVLAPKKISPLSSFPCQLLFFTLL